MPKRRSNPKSAHANDDPTKQRQKLAAVHEAGASDAEISEALVTEAVTSDASPGPSSPTPELMTKKRKAAKSLLDFWRLHSNESTKRQAKITAKHAKEIRWTFAENSRLRQFA